VCTVTMRSFLYFIREALGGFRKNLSTVLGAIVTIYLSLLVIGIFLTATLLINQLVTTVENQISITIFISDTASDEDVWALQSFISTIPEVSNVTYITKEEAMERFKEQNTHPDFVSVLPEDALPASIEVELNDPSKVSDVAQIIMDQELFLRVNDTPNNPTESIKYSRETAERLFSITRIIRYICLGAIALLAFVALIFINNTIRLAIFSRRAEIAIMRLVGASNSFIRGPFLMEAALQALLGSGLAIVTLYFAIDRMQTSVTLNIPWLTVNFSLIPFDYIYLALLGSGLTLGMLGSIWAMRRYLQI